MDAPMNVRPLTILVCSPKATGISLAKVAGVTWERLLNITAGRPTQAAMKRSTIWAIAMRRGLECYALQPRL